MNVKTVKGKRLILFFTVTLLLFLTACGSQGTSSQNSNTDSTNNSGEVEAEGKSHHLVLSDVLPENHTLTKNVWEPFISMLEEQSDGRITTEIYHSSALGEVPTGYDMAVTGTADISQSAHGYVQRNFPLTSVVELPFFSKTTERGSEILWQLYQEFPALQAEYEDTVPLWFGLSDSGEFYSIGSPIEKPEDLKGKRVRTPSPLGNQIIEELGGTAVTMPIGDVYEALQRGVIDVAFVAMGTAKDVNLHEIVDYITIGNFSTTPFFSVMNQSTYDSLSNSDKELMQSLGEEMVPRGGAAFDAEKTVGVEVAKASDATILELTEEQKEEWREALQPVIDKWISDLESQGLPAQEIYDRAIELNS